MRPAYTHASRSGDTSSNTSASDWLGPQILYLPTQVPPFHTASASQYQLTSPQRARDPTPCMKQIPLSLSTCSSTCVILLIFFSCIFLTDCNHDMKFGEPESNLPYAIGPKECKCSDLFCLVSYEYSMRLSQRLTSLYESPKNACGLPKDAKSLAPSTWDVLSVVQSSRWRRNTSLCWASTFLPASSLAGAN